MANINDSDSFIQRAPSLPFSPFNRTPWFNPAFARSLTLKENSNSKKPQLDGDNDALVNDSRNGGSLNQKLEETSTSAAAPRKTNSLLTKSLNDDKRDPLSPKSSPAQTNSSEELKDEEASADMQTRFDAVKNEVNQPPAPANRQTSKSPHHRQSYFDAEDGKTSTAAAAATLSSRVSDMRRFNDEEHLSPPTTMSSQSCYDFKDFPALKQEACSFYPHAPQPQMFDARRESPANYFADPTQMASNHLPSAYHALLNNNLQYNQQMVKHQQPAAMSLHSNNNLQQMLCDPNSSVYSNSSHGYPNDFHSLQHQNRMLKETILYLEASLTAEQARAQLGMMEAKQQVSEGILIELVVVCLSVY